MISPNGSLLAPPLDCGWNLSSCKVIMHVINDLTPAAHILYLCDLPLR